MVLYLLVIYWSQVGREKLIVEEGLQGEIEDEEKIISKRSVVAI
jgi:hypothetical protein